MNERVSIICTAAGNSEGDAYLSKRQNDWRDSPPYDRGREGATSPPSEPCERFSRTRLSSRWFPHRECLARAWAVCRVNSRCSAKKAFGHRW
jgi:hypothetical protein